MIAAHSSATSGSAPSRISAPMNNPNGMSATGELATTRTASALRPSSLTGSGKYAPRKSWWAGMLEAQPVNSIIAPAIPPDSRVRVGRLRPAAAVSPGRAAATFGAQPC